LTPIKWVQLALLVMRFANWIAAKVDEATWKASGYREAMAEQAAQMSRSIGLADKAVEEARAAPPTERRNSLESDL